MDDAPACLTMSIFHDGLAAGLPPAAALHDAQAAIRGLSGAELAARYIELGGEGAHVAATRRRGTATAELAPKLDLGDEFTDNVYDEQPLDELGGNLPRVWAPFVVIGV